MKKARISFYLDTDLKERLEDLSRRTREPMGEYIHEALENLIEKYESTEKDRIEEDNSRLPVGERPGRIT